MDLELDFDTRDAKEKEAWDVGWCFGAAWLFKQPDPVSGCGWLSMLASADDDADGMTKFAFRAFPRRVTNFEVG